MSRRGLPSEAKWEQMLGVERILRMGRNILVLGTPDENDPYHNCDYMGCSSVECILATGLLHEEFWEEASDE